MKNIISTAILCISAVFADCAFAQPADVAYNQLEIMPDHIIRRIQQDDSEQAISRLRAEGRVQEGVITGAKRWDSGTPISVCFFGGSTDLRRHIVQVASTWERQGAPVQFDFGDRNNPNLCRANRRFDIRIGYSQSGYWSMIGQDSLVHVGQYEQSMNFARFDYAPPSNDEFNRVVLHEFGHALGFQHEHQQARVGCEQEFDWPVVNRYLQGPPNYWSAETINFNMRTQGYTQGDVSTNFNARSIMLYTFPISFYREGARSRCYSPGNSEISPGDAQLLRRAYGGSGPSRATQGQALIAAASTLPVTERASIAERVRFFNASQAVQNQIMRIGNQRYTDVAVRACSTSPATLALVEEVTQALNQEPRLGQLAYRGLATGQAFPAGVTVLADLNHPEIADARQLARSLSNRFGQVRVQEQPGSSRWLLGVVVCAP